MESTCKGSLELGPNAFKPTIFMFEPSESQLTPQVFFFFLFFQRFKKLWRINGYFLHFPRQPQLLKLDSLSPGENWCNLCVPFTFLSVTVLFFFQYHHCSHQSMTKKKAKSVDEIDAILFVKSTNFFAGADTSITSDRSGQTLVYHHLELPT